MFKVNKVKASLGRALVPATALCGIIVIKNSGLKKIRIELN